MTPFAVTVIWFLTTLNNAGELAVVDKTDLPSGITSTAMWSEGQCSYVRAHPERYACQRFQSAPSIKWEPPK